MRESAWEVVKISTVWNSFLPLKKKQSIMCLSHNLLSFMTYHETNDFSISLTTLWNVKRPHHEMVSMYQPTIHTRYSSYAKQMVYAGNNGATWIMFQWSMLWLLQQTSSFLPLSFSTKNRECLVTLENNGKKTGRLMLVTNRQREFLLVRAGKNPTQQ